MALFAIPNPKKTFSVDYSIDNVKKAVLAIPFIDKKYKYTKSNDVLNQHTLEALEFLSLGVFIDFNLSSISENKTEITVEIRRKVGSFDQSHEITNANKHIEAIVDNLSKGITLTDIDIENLKKAESDKAVVQKEKEKHANKRSLIIGAVIILVIIIFNLLKK